MRSTNTPEQKNNNQAKDVSSLNNPSDNSSSDNSSSSDDMLAMRESSVIRDKERPRGFMNRQKLLFERSSQRKPSEFERVKETFNIDPIDILEQAADIPEQAADTRCSRNMLNR